MRGAGTVPIMTADGLTVLVIGALAVRAPDRVLRGIEVGSRKARTLLAMLAVCAEHTTAGRLAAALWADASPRDPPANIATLVSRLRARLGAAVIEKDGAGYRLGVHVRVDLRDTAELVAHAESLTGLPAYAAARRATRVLESGQVLAEEPDAAWAEPARDWHHGLLRRARHTLAAAALRVGDLQTARAAAETATTADMFDETAHRLLMRAHHAAGEPAQAVLAYERLRATLATELGIDPAPRTQELHLAILREDCLSTT